MTESHNTWLYAVVPAERVPPRGVTGVAGERLHAVVGPGISAVAGSVPRTEFDEAPLHAHLEDIAWLEHAVRTHHRVIDALTRTGPALPLRFATIYRDDRRAAAMIHERQDELRSALERISDRTEWGVKAYLVHRPVPAEAAGGDPGAADRPGTAYLLRRRAQHQDHEQSLRRALDDGQQIHAALAGAAAEATQHPLQTAEAAGRTEPMVLNGAYLLDGSRQADLEKTLAALAARYPDLQLEVTGPWPPYSFAALTTTPERK